MYYTIYIYIHSISYYITSCCSESYYIILHIILYDVIKHLYVFNHKDLRYQIWANFHELLVDYNIPSSWMFMDCYNPPIIYTIIYCVYIYIYI